MRDDIYYIIMLLYIHDIYYISVCLPTKMKHEAKDLMFGFSDTLVF